MSANPRRARRATFGPWCRWQASGMQSGCAARPQASGPTQPRRGFWPAASGPSALPANGARDEPSKEGARLSTVANLPAYGTALGGPSGPRQRPPGPETMLGHGPRLARRQPSRPASGGGDRERDAGRRSYKRPARPHGSQTRAPTAYLRSGIRGHVKTRHDARPVRFASPALGCDYGPSPMCQTV